MSDHNIVVISRFFLKVNFALSLDRTKRQWIDLGYQTKTCMARPETCGAAGGAISMWVNILHRHGKYGIVSSIRYGKSGSTVYLEHNYLR